MVGRFSWIRAPCSYSLGLAAELWTLKRLSARCLETPLLKRLLEVYPTVKMEVTVPALIECSVRLWKPMKSRKWIKIVVLSSHFPVNQSSTKSINPFMIHPILNQKNTALIGTQLKLSGIRMENYLQSITLKNFIFLIRICRKKFKRTSRRVILMTCYSD